VLEQGFHTLDGRIKEKGLFTPGGDAGEFILALQVFQDMKREEESNFTLEYDHVKNFLTELL
jgi:hypothetical protein